jgi:beta-alanine--pyruvate transaminase
LSPRAEAPGTRGLDILVDAFWNSNLLIRVTGDIVALSPPLIVSESQIGEIVDGVRASLRRLA